MKIINKLILSLSLILTMLTGCNTTSQENTSSGEHEHTYMKMHASGPTCTSSGFSLPFYYKCQSCGQLFDTEKHEIIYDDYVVPALGHDYLIVDKIEPTFESNGSYTYECSRCENSYITKIDKLEHNFLLGTYIYDEENDVHYHPCADVGYEYLRTGEEKCTKVLQEVCCYLDDKVTSYYYECLYCRHESIENIDGIIDFPGEVTIEHDETGHWIKSDTSFKVGTNIGNIKFEVDGVPYIFTSKERLNYEEHPYNETHIEESETSIGSITYSCPVCEYTKTKYFYKGLDVEFLENNEVKLLAKEEITDIETLTFPTTLTYKSVNYKVTNIGSLEKLTNLKRLTLPASLNSIDEHALSGLKLEYLALPIPKMMYFRNDGKYYNADECNDVDKTNVAFDFIRYLFGMNEKEGFYNTIYQGESVRTLSTYIKSYVPNSLKEIEILQNDTYTLPNLFFFNINQLEYINIPKSITYFGRGVFAECSSLKGINYKGTIEEWNHIIRGEEWNDSVDSIPVSCTDGVVSLY